MNTYTCANCGRVWDRQTVIGNPQFELLDPEDFLVGCPECESKESLSDVVLSPKEG
jgi:hypothetical protein